MAGTSRYAAVFPSWSGPLSRRYGFDLHDVGGRRPMIVSRGIGATESALRVNADPDIRVVTLGRGPSR